MSALVRKMETGACGMVSAFRGENTRAENMQRHNELLNFLKGKDVSAVTVSGHYWETPEEGAAVPEEARRDEQGRVFVAEKTFFVSLADVAKRGDSVDTEMRDIISEAGSEFDQEAVIFIPYQPDVEITQKRVNLITGLRDMSNDELTAFTIGRLSVGKGYNDLFSVIKNKAFAFLHKKVYDVEYQEIEQAA